ncbi:SDR family NAD(P)-dependent oxidoreductase [Leptospira bourretii]|uniref:SDR family NAD(P)-dependent oxidoreductase n=1 Tax=Leptospira bourretii TaxID=2484962 RepID=A0A4R9IP65_9LEPT|nr:SDR family NAD(P)-dependent oxidoreductase [Leptospira bourretii]TGK90289.1 SDR family NAD(P)-dependent oxidoreductase [Leptospira bourretii]TGK93687.1 SDR family NAD(P)-dependent oxidoreductase [Leptospira bourretii]TGL22694.1 SDR family NAD(P)-dependent oxidoreductase [Leptospira bourretii]TGL42540.1 SDR family NAD(P)-dependent oxidoreductase [Leptospira bourretii]
MRLSSKKIVLSSGSSPLGKELLPLLLAEGALVVVGDSNPEEIPNHPNLQKYKIDPSKPEQMERLIESAIETLDKIDVFILNSEQITYAEDEKEDWNRLKILFNANTLAPIHTIQRLTNLISVGLHIIVVSSDLTKVPTPGFGLYGSSKAALDYFWDSFRGQIGREFRFSRVIAMEPKLSKGNRLANRVLQSILRPKKRRYEHFYQWGNRFLLNLLPFLRFFRTLAYAFRLKQEKKKKISQADLLPSSEN